MDITLLAQMVSLALPAAWLTLGVRDNILHPAVNEAYTAEVLGMHRIREDFPEAYEPVAGRAITDRATQKRAFRLIVFSEALTVVVMWIGVVCLGMAIMGVIWVELARNIAMIGALMFTTIWAMFTVVGNHFAYWFGHEIAQNTHFQLTLWGMANLIFLAV